MRICLIFLLCGQFSFASVISTGYGDYSLKGYQQVHNFEADLLNFERDGGESKLLSDNFRSGFDVDAYIENLDKLFPPPGNMKRFEKFYKAYPPEPKNFRDSNYISIAPEVLPAGPSIDLTRDHDIEEAFSRQGAYFQSIFKALIQAAHKYASDYDYKEGSPYNYTYYSFLVAALTVPIQESRLNHFRKVTSDRCYEDINNLSVYSDRLLYKNATGENTPFYKTALLDTAKVLNRYFKVPEEPYFPDCMFLNRTPDLQQVLTSSTLMDFGLMQINIKSHQKDFLRPEMALNLYETIDNGVEYLWNQKDIRGFVFLREQLKTEDNEYSKECEFNENPFYNIEDVQGDQVKTKVYSNSKPSIYYNLIRGSWAGFYNQGRGGPENVCRFANESAPNHSHDFEFQRSLDSVVKFDTSLWHKYLPKNSAEYLALKEIVHNFRSIFAPNLPPEERKFLNIVLNSPLTIGRDKPYLNYSKYEASHILIHDKVDVYQKASLRNENGVSNKCGFIQNPIKKAYFKVKVLDTVTDSKQRKWAKISLPKYANYFSKETPLFVVKKESSKVIPSVRLTRGLDAPLASFEYTEEVQKRNPRMELVSQEGNWLKLIIDQGQYWVHTINFDVIQGDFPKASGCNKRDFYVDESLVNSINREPIGYGVLKVNFVEVRKYPDSDSQSVGSYTQTDEEFKIPIFGKVVEPQKQAGSDRVRYSTWYSTHASGGLPGFVKADQIQVYLYENDMDLVSDDESSK